MRRPVGERPSAARAGISSYRLEGVFCIFCYPKKESALSGDLGGLKKRMVSGLIGLHKKGASSKPDKTDTLKKRSVNDDRQRHDTGGGA